MVISYMEGKSAWCYGKGMHIVVVYCMEISPLPPYSFYTCSWSHTISFSLPAPPSLLLNLSQFPYRSPFPFVLSIYPSVPHCPFLLSSATSIPSPYQAKRNYWYIPRQSVICLMNSPTSSKQLPGDVYAFIWLSYVLPLILEFGQIKDSLSSWWWCLK